MRGALNTFVPSYCEAIYAFLLCHRTRGGVFARVPKDVALVIARMVKESTLAEGRSILITRYKLAPYGRMTMDTLINVVPAECLFSETMDDCDDNGYSCLKSRRRFELYDELDALQAEAHIQHTLSSLEKIFYWKASGLSTFKILRSGLASGTEKGRVADMCPSFLLQRLTKDAALIVEFSFGVYALK